MYSTHWEYMVKRNFSTLMLILLPTRSAPVPITRHTMDVQSTQCRIFLNMENILVYTVFSRHHEFINNLIKHSINNIIEQYHSFPMLVQKLQQLSAKITDENFVYEHKVVIFFFFITIDCKMRYFLLCSQQSPEEKSRHRDILIKNIKMAPPGSMQTLTNTNNPFLGQSVVFRPLNSHAAVSIFMNISQEDFFDPVYLSEDTQVIHDIFIKIKELVLLS